MCALGNKNYKPTAEIEQSMNPEDRCCFCASLSHVGGKLGVKCLWVSPGGNRDSLGRHQTSCEVWADPDLSRRARCWTGPSGELHTAGCGFLVGGSGDGSSGAMKWSTRLPRWSRTTWITLPIRHTQVTKVVVIFRDPIIRVNVDMTQKQLVREKILCWIEIHNFITVNETSLE